MSDSDSIVPLDQMITRLQANQHDLRPPCVMVVNWQGTYRRRFETEEEAQKDASLNLNRYVIVFNSRGKPVLKRC